MGFNYYLDESGNTGDLISRTADLNFGGQPIFTLSCVGIPNLSKVEDFISNLKSDHDIKDCELKSSELYFKKPSVFLELAKFMAKERMPVLVELVDKKYCVSATIVNHQIMPPYYMSQESELDGSCQFIRSGIADYLTSNINDNLFKEFCRACKEPSEDNLLSSFEKLKDLFGKGIQGEFDFFDLTVKSVDETIDDYKRMKSKLGLEKAIEKFLPIPDVTEKGASIKLLPHVHSIYNVIARLNKYHQKSIGGVTLYHDKQNDFDSILSSCKEYIVNTTFNESIPPIQHSDFEVIENFKLEFIDSEINVGIQIADMVAGFFNRYINGLLYKKVKVEEIYHSIFMEFGKNLNPMSPLGVNLVIPQSKKTVALG